MGDSPALPLGSALLALLCCVLMLLCPRSPCSAGGHQRGAGVGWQLLGVTRGWQGWDGSSLGVPRAGDGQTDLFDCELEPCVMGGPGTIPLQSIPAHSLPEQCREPGRENGFSPFLNTALSFFLWIVWGFFSFFSFFWFFFSLSSSLYMFGVFCVCVRAFHRESR